MSKDCVSKLYKICDEEHVKVLEPVYIAGKAVPGKNVIVNVNSRFKNSEELDFLEQNLSETIREDLIRRLTISLYMRELLPRKN